MTERGVTVGAVDDGGRYSGAASRAVSYLPGPLRSFLHETGGIMQLLGQVLWSAVRHPTGYWGEVRDYTYLTLRRSALAIALALFGFTTLFAVLILVFFQQLGTVSLYPSLGVRVNIEAFMVWSIALVMSGIVGAALTTELGARGVREELDAMRVLGLDPVRELVVPRVVATIMLTGLTALPSTLLVVLISAFGSNFYASMNAAEYFYFMSDNLAPSELWFAVLNCVVAGMIIASICAYKGMNASGGSAGLGRAVNQAVVLSFLVVWIYQTLYTGVIQGIFDLGRYR